MTHLASFSVSPRAIRAYVREGKRQLRIQSGFGITREEAEVAGLDSSQLPSKFTFLNEGMTETIVAFVTNDQWKGYHPYTVNRLCIQLLLRAIVHAKSKTEKSFSLRNAWTLLSTDYFNNTFTFAKELDVLFGKGTTRMLATIADKYESENALVEKLSEWSKVSIGPEVLTDLRGDDHTSKGHHTLEEMERELIKAVL